jgi:hypothetical protein
MVDERVEDAELDDVLDRPFETPRGTVLAREATADEVRHVIDALDAARTRLVRKLIGTKDDDVQGHLRPRIAALSWQIADLRVVLDWSRARRAA